MKRIVIVLLVALVGIIVGYRILDHSEEPSSPEVINPSDVEPEMVDSILRNKGYGHRIDKFQFQDQLGKQFGSSDLEGKIYVAEYFFTTCSTICPRMNTQMKRIQQEFATNDQVHLVSLTVDPETDDVEQMKRYAASMGAKTNKWHFLTGPKEDLYRLARTSFFVLKPADVANAGDAGSDFIHTNNFVLVDAQKRIRGYYDGTSAKEVNGLMEDINTLLKEND